MQSSCAAYPNHGLTKQKIQWNINGELNKKFNGTLNGVIGSQI